MVRYSFPVGLFHSLLHAGFHRRFRRGMPRPGSTVALLDAEFVAQFAHLLNDARPNLAHFFGSERALGRPHRQPEGDALLAFLERRAGVLAHELNRFQ